MTQYPIPAIGAPVVILYGPPEEMTWDDSGADLIGIEGTLTEILGPDWLAPFVVRTTDGRTVYASKIRAADEAEHPGDGREESVSVLETDPRRIAEVEESLAELRDRLNRPAW